MFHFYTISNQFRSILHMFVGYGVHMCFLQIRMDLWILDTLETISLYLYNIHFHETSNQNKFRHLVTLCLISASFRSFLALASMPFFLFSEILEQSWSSKPFANSCEIHDLATLEPELDQMIIPLGFRMTPDVEQIKRTPEINVRSMHFGHAFLLGRGHHFDQPPRLHS